jgi:hypothetical protein
MHAVTYVTLANSPTPRNTVLSGTPSFCQLVILARNWFPPYFKMTSPMENFDNLGGGGVHEKLHRLQRILKEYRPDVGPFVDTYKDIHQHPELSCFESRPACVVVDCLRYIGLEMATSVGGRGVVGIFKNGPGKTILLRAELDALPIQENTGLPYASKVRMKDVVGRD